MIGNILFYGAVCIAATAAVIAVVGGLCIVQTHIFGDDGS